MKGSNVLRGIGLLASLVGLAANLLTNYVNEKKMEEKIEQEVQKALSDKESES